ncbi:MAG: citramalate synthase [Phycisphaerae bacterium]
MNTTQKQRVEIYDTTLRDGTQALGVSLSLEDKLLIAAELDKLGVDYIEGGYPLSNPKDEAFFRQAARKDFAHAKITAFGMTRRKNIAAADDTGMKALLASEAPVVTIVGKTWDLHVHEVLRVSEEENLAMIADSVKLMVDHDREMIYDAEHFFDGYKANPEYAIRTLRAAHEAGAGRLVLCDTNGGSLPETVAEAIEALKNALPDAKIGIHCHNDGDLATANSIVAVRHGAHHVQGTINGIGERCGNADLTAVAANLALKYDYDVLADGALSHLTEISRFVYEVANMNFRDNQPFVGLAAFAHKGGMHVHAVQRNVHSYEHMDPSLVGNSRRVLVSELSGVSNISAAAPEKFHIGDDKEAQRKVLRAVMELENQGYQFEAAEGSFEMLIRRTLGGDWYRQLWKLDHYRCTILRRDGGEPNTEATVKIEVNGKIEHTVSEGEGPVDSLYRALAAALADHFPALGKLHLADYKVRVVNTAAETAAKVRVVIEWHDEEGKAFFGTVGVSDNIIDASWKALVDAIEFLILSNETND